MESEFSYQLQQPVEYAHDGDIVTGTVMTLHEPTSQHIVECGKLRQWFSQAISEMQDDLPEGDVDRLAEEQEAEEGDPVRPDGKMIVSLLASSSIPLDKFFSCTTQIIQSKGVALLDDQQSMNPSLWKKVSARDLEEMIGEYVANFLMR